MFPHTFDRVGGETSFRRFQMFHRVGGGERTPLRESEAEGERRGRAAATHCNGVRLGVIGLGESQLRSALLK